METISKIRRLYHKEGQSIRAIARKMNLNRRTVKKYVEQTELAHNKEPALKHYRALGDYLIQFNERLEEEQAQPKVQRMSAKRHYEWLQRCGYQGCYSTVSAYVRQYHGTHVDKTVFIPQHFPIGDAYQFDWSTETVELAGIKQKVQVAHFRLCHCRAYFVRAYPSQKMEMLIDAHNHAFAHFGGTPKRGIYDNMKTAVKAIGSGKEREFNPQFLALMNHYLIEPVACTPASGWEKGQVERQVRTLRKQVFEPMLAFESFDALNAYLLKQCQERIVHTLHPDDKNTTVALRFEQEKQVLSPNQPYECARVEQTVVNSLSLVSFDSHRYSVPCQYSSSRVELHIRANEIKVIAQGKEIAAHRRSFDKQQTTYNPWHYLPALERKPGALRNGAPFASFAHWKLPSAIKQLQDHLLAQPKGDRAMVKLLSLIAEYGEDLGVAAAQIALEESMPTVAAVLNIIHRLKEPVIPEVNSYEIPLKMPLLAELARYDRLLSQTNRACLGGGYARA